MMSGVVGAIAAASLLQQPASTLSVRVVDAHRSPLPGISVRVAEAGNCLTPEANSLPQLLAVTRVDGSVEFSVASDRVYVVTVEAQGGLEGRRDCLDRVPRGPVYSQIELRTSRLHLSRTDGALNFSVERGRVTGFSVTRPTVKARKRT